MSPDNTLKWIRLIVPELGRLQFSIDCQFPIFAFYGGKGVKFQISSL